MTIEPGKEYRPTGSVDFYDWLGPNFTVMTADQIAKDATRFIVQGTDSYGAKNFFKVEVRSPTGVKIGWVPVPVIAPVGASLPTTPSAPVTQASGTAAESLTMGQFASFDRTTKVLTIKDLIGASFEFAVRDDTMLSTSTGASRLDDYLESNFNNYPWSFGQLVSITWKPSVDGKRRVAISIR